MLSQRSIDRPQDPTAPGDGSTLVTLSAVRASHSRTELSEALDGPAGCGQSRGMGDETITEWFASIYLQSQATVAMN